MKETILHISHTHISTTESRIMKQLEDIKKKFSNYKIITIGIRKESKYNNDLFPLKGIKDLSFSLITKKLFFIPKFIKHFLNYIELIIRSIFIIYKNKLKIKIVHCHFFTVLPIGYIIKFLFNCKLVYDAHELESAKSFVKYSKLIFFIEKFLWKKIDLFITVSPSILNWYNKNFGKKKNSIAVFNSPKIKKITKIKKNTLRNKLKISKNDLIFVYVGGFQYGRGINHMLNVFSNSSIKSHLVFIGYGILEKNIKKFSNKFNNIHILKPVPHNELVQFISSANIGLSIIEKVSLSDFYCLPNKFFEYAFANLYILASNFPDMKRLVKFYSLGKCISPNIKSLTREVKSIENNKNKIKVFKKNLTNLSWEAQSLKLIINYKKITHKN